MPWPRVSPRSAAEWGVVLPLWLAMIGLVFVVVFWAITGRLESALLNVFGTVALGSQGLRVLEQLKEPAKPRRRKPPARPGDEKA
jgi:hypothetical protein